MRPFCANEKCFLHAHEVPNERTAVEVQFPTGKMLHVTRGWLLVESQGWQYPLCEICATALEAMRRDGENLNRNMAVSLGIDVSHLRPFCAIPKCFLHDLDAPADQPHVDVGLPSGSTLRYGREWLVSKREGRRWLLCESCGNVLAVIRGDGESFQPDAGLQLHGMQVSPDGEIVDEYVPEPDAEIVEPEVQSE